MCFVGLEKACPTRDSVGVAVGVRGNQSCFCGLLGPCMIKARALSMFLEQSSAMAAPCHRSFYGFHGLDLVA